MKANLAPKHTQSVNDSMILWFEKSNQYTIVDNGLYFCIQTFLEAKNQERCLNTYKNTFQFTLEKANAIFSDVEQFLLDRNIPLETEENTISKLDSTQRKYTKHYTCGSFNFDIHFQSEVLINYLHPQLQHLENSHHIKPNFWFDIYEENHQIKLFTNNHFIKSCGSQDFHELQGKFNMELICALHNKKEHDWLGLLHASTVSNNSKSVMLIGTSGSGKSTLTTLLTQHGYELIADDTTPILRTDLNTYYFPGGISVKPGAFSTIKPYISNFEDLPESYLRAYKGGIKYVSSPIPQLTNTPCNHIVLVNYKADSKTVLEPIEAKTALEVLIPDSWISPKSENAKAFLKWINCITFFKLTYSNNQDAIDIFSTIFIDE
ncbi:hypothetical protein [Formosa algae]|uniref:HPr kinase/phosphorylase C-terminal domain-containing protein n=1 Tax=Formosa algae TaxID=225843 RepID=A0A9X0YI81_9FLAO|nr:hypothetical protein [Formosa algae]MBP1839137.1 hypothetical protein [Formosa algae]MDQ0333914.1 hypothetical protein [Formosa algae]OEI79297.1 hypothetical protein AST99_15095 [Formosa algae]